MADTDTPTANRHAYAGPERRLHARQRFNSLSYVELEESNGGILLNVGEGGLAVHAAVAVMDETLTRIRLQPPRSKKRLETAARIVWTSDSRRMLGIEFTNPSEDFLAQLRDWLAAEAAATAKAAALAEQMLPEAEVGDTPHPSAGQAAGQALPRSLRALATVAAPVPEQRKSDFDIAAILTSARNGDAAEAAVKVKPGVTAAEELVAAELAGQPKPPPEIAPALTKSVPVVLAAATRQTEPNSPRRYVPALIFLAALSLLAGWEAGRGNLFSALFQSSSAASPSAGSASGRFAGNPVFANFLVIDASDQSWLVPFAGPTDAGKVSPSPALPPQTAAARAAIEAASAVTTQPTYHVGTLYAPQSSQRARAIQSTASAPAIASAAPSAAFTSSLGDPSSAFNLAPPPMPAASKLVPATVTRRVDPVYPRDALDQRLQGAVKVQAHIGADGAVSNVRAVSGSPLLSPAAIEAVRRWKYKPEILDGRPVASDIDLIVQFKLPE